jgi:hypothetical protein
MNKRAVKDSRGVMGASARHYCQSAVRQQVPV